MMSLLINAHLITQFYMNIPLLPPMAQALGPLPSEFLAACGRGRGAAG